MQSPNSLLGRTASNARLDPRPPAGPPTVGCGRTLRNPPVQLVSGPPPGQLRGTKDFEDFFGRDHDGDAHVDPAPILPHRLYLRLVDLVLANVPMAVHQAEKKEPPGERRLGGVRRLGPLTDDRWEVDGLADEHRASTDPAHRPGFDQVHLALVGIPGD